MDASKAEKEMALAWLKILDWFLNLLEFRGKTIQSIYGTFQLFN